MPNGFELHHQSRAAAIDTAVAPAKANTLSLLEYILLLLLGRFNGWPAYVIIESLKCVAAAAASQAQEEQHTLECCNP